MVTTANIPNPGASAKAIQHHYDVSDEFFSLWLDPSLTYSSGIWEEGETIEEFKKAQMRKLDYHYEKYLSMSIIAFHTGTTNVSCITMQRINHPRK